MGRKTVEHYSPLDDINNLMLFAGGTMKIDISPVLKNMTVKQIGFRHRSLTYRGLKAHTE
jgi:hypothetical protein